MEQQLATTEDAQRLARNFENRLKEIVDWGVELRNVKPTLARAHLALERSQDIRRYLDDIEASDLRELARRMHEAHKFMLQLLNRVKKPAEMVQKYCSDIRADWEVVRRRYLEAERRRREEEANRLAAEQRKAEIAHLHDIGNRAQAEALAAAPVVPISVSVDANAGKPAGEVMVEVWVPKLDENENVMFNNLGAYLHWMADRPEMHYLVDHKYGKLKKLLTDNRGNLQPPGLEIEHKFEPRTRREAESDG